MISKYPYLADSTYLTHFHEFTTKLQFSMNTQIFLPKQTTNAQLRVFRDFDEDDGDEKSQNPAQAAKEMKEALASGGMGAVADIGAGGAAKLGGMMSKGFGFGGKALGSFF